MPAEMAADLQRIGDFPAKIIRQDGDGLAREGCGEHFRGAARAAGVTDQAVRHGAEAVRCAEEMRGAVIGVADEAGSALTPGRFAADTGGVRHEGLHFRAGAMPRIHGQEFCARQDRHIW